MIVQMMKTRVKMMHLQVVMKIKCFKQSRKSFF